MPLHRVGDTLVDVIQWVVQGALVTMVVEAFVSSVNQAIETGIEEIRVQDTEPLNDGFLNIGISSEMAILNENHLVRDPGFGERAWPP
ncbi:hypothetical protein AVEN_157904-1 [Araneus ventricosus]|uniref:Uncharacterized protein n=1 Tax=Araneus ventricosus TaxID=182803 RepID=A0A4Y2FGS2_ARAVE|nr:hypothetical protein AVEN_157904-1 [Araneus ventricosus]